MKVVWYDEFPIGALGIAEDGKGICNVFFPEKPPAGDLQERSTPLLEQAARQLREYFSGERRSFELPLSLEGTPFQRRVWQALRQIPYGQSRSYGEIAAATGSPRASRAVGMANNRNPVMILVPCHRVLGRDGSLVGYAGGLEIKKKLLELEGIAYKSHINRICISG